MYASRVYIGHTGHSRLTPVKHSFRYPVNYYVFDLDELQKLSDGLYLFGYNKSRPISIYDDDYLGRERPGTPIKQKLYSVLKERSLDPRPISRIELVTSARYFGHAFNPVNFYYCYHKVEINEADREVGNAISNEQLYAMVVEINNTFGETHVHVIKSDESALPANATEDPYQNKKLTKSTFVYNYVRWRDFHVSPFNDRQGYFHFQFADVRKELRVKISQTDVAFNPIVIATLRGEHCYSLCDSVIAKNIIKYPITALMTFPRILVQAGKLHFRKKLPIYVKPNPTQPDTIILIPPGALQVECMTRVTDAWRALFSTKAALLPVGHLSMQLPDGTIQSFGVENSAKPKLELKVDNYDFFNRIYEHGSFGSALAFMADDFSCPVEQVRDWLAFLQTTSKATSQCGSQSQSKPVLKNGNKLTVPESTAQERFLANFLDSTMSFHCPSFDKHSVNERPLIDISETHPKSRGPQSLEKAQVQGINQLLDLASIKSEHKVLGWGALTAILEERNTGCTITCVVLTVQQLLYVRKRLPSNSNVSVILFEDFLEQNASDGAQSFDVIFAVECSEMYAAYMTSQRIQSRAGRSATPTRQELFRFFELCYIKLVQGGQLIIQSVHRVADTRSAEIKNQLSVPIVRPSIGAKWRMQKARASRWMEIKLFEHITEYVVNPFELDKRFYRNFSFVPNVHIISAPEAVPSSVDILAAATGSKFTMEAMKDLGSSDYTIAYKTWANNLDQSRVDIRTSGSVTLYDNAVNSERDRQLSEELKRQFRYYLRGAQHLFELGLFGVSRFVFSKQS